MTRVVDAGLVVAALVDGGPVGTWAEGMLAGGEVRVDEMSGNLLVSALEAYVHEAGEIAPRVEERPASRQASRKAGRARDALEMALVSSPA